MAAARLEAAGSVTLLLASDREALRVFWAGTQTRASLEKLDRQQFEAIMAVIFQNYDQDFSNRGKRSLPDLTYSIGAYPGMREWWTQYKDIYRDSEFATYVDATVDAVAQKTLQRSVSSVAERAPPTKALQLTWNSAFQTDAGGGILASTLGALAVASGLCHATERRIH